MDEGTLQTITQTQYDADGRVVATIDADGKSSTTEYDKEGRVSATVGRISSNDRTAYHYNAKGDLIETVYPDGTVTRTQYDLAGRAVLALERFKPADANSRWYASVTAYDAQGRVQSVTRKANVLLQVAADSAHAGLYAYGTIDSTSASAAQVSQTSSTYDNAGRVLTSTGADNKTTKYEYDPAGRQVKTIDPLNQSTQNSYDVLGRLVATIDANTHSTSFSYDSLGRQIRTTYADGSFVSTGYDELDRKVSQTDQLFRTTYYGYDELGRLTGVAQPPVTVGGVSVSPKWNYAYDKAGNLVSQTDPLGHVTSYTYAKLGRRLSRTLPNVTTWVDDSDDNFDHPDTEVAVVSTETWTYDGLGRTASHTDFKGQVESERWFNRIFQARRLIGRLPRHERVLFCGVQVAGDHRSAAGQRVVDCRVLPA